MEREQILPKFYRKPGIIFTTMELFFGTLWNYLFLIICKLQEGNIM